MKKLMLCGDVRQEGYMALLQTVKKKGAVEIEVDGNKTCYFNGKVCGEISDNFKPDSYENYKAVGNDGLIILVEATKKVKKQEQEIVVPDWAKDFYGSEKVAYMQSLGMTREQIMMVINKWKPFGADLNGLIPDFSKLNYVQSKDGELFRLLGYMLVEQPDNVCICGVQSTGKNTLIDTLASLMMKPLYKIDFSEETTASDLEGSKTISVEKVEINPNTLLANAMVAAKDFQREAHSDILNAYVNAELASHTTISKVEFQEECLAKAARNGCWIVMNEINMANQAMMSRYHSLLDYQRMMYIPTIGMVKAKDGFVAFCTKNPMSYAGTHEMNQALESRFAITIELKPHDSIVDVLEAQCPNANYEDIEAANRVYMSIKNLVMTHEVSDAFLSVRNYVAAVKNKGFCNIKQSLLDHLVNATTNYEDDSKKVRDIIQNNLL